MPRVLTLSVNEKEVPVKFFRGLRLAGSLKLNSRVNSNMVAWRRTTIHG
jgi:hypothetical protein